MRFRITGKEEKPQMAQIDPEMKFPNKPMRSAPVQSFEFKIQRCQKLRNEPNRHSCRLVCIGGSSKNYQTNPICVELAQSLSTPVRLRVENIWDPAVSDRRYTFFAKRTQLIFSPSAKSVKSAVQQFLPNEAKAGSAAVPGQCH